jgi:hypothetical protein
MMKRCLDEGLLQAYIDGELSQAQMSEAAAHVAACESCAAAIAVAESESAIFSSAFAPDDSISVPTGALRSRINAAVAQLETTSDANQDRSRGRSLSGFLAPLSAMFNFTPRSAAAFASLLAVVAVALIYIAVQKSNPAPNRNQGRTLVASNNPTPAPSTAVTPNVTPPTPVAAPTGGIKILKADYRRKPLSRGTGTHAPVNNGQELLPGEKDYRTAIASLEKTIKLGGDTALRPAVRVEYERNLAILDSAIGQTRQVAAHNPKDRDAVGFLMSAYQSKVELLTKVADQAQIAALGR